LALVETQVRTAGFYSVIKRTVDVSLILLLAPLWVPLYLIITAAILLLTGSPVHYRSVRIGMNGQEFWVLKFRSMRRDAEFVLQSLLSANPELNEEFTQTVKLRCDPRVTFIGRILRRTSLDELPQLFNVLRGNMALVGPRPATRLELEEFYGAYAPQVLAVRPGMTGLWQVSGRSLLSYEQRVALDVQYAALCGVRSDLMILLRTLPIVLRGHGAF
jgi:exopolysaccharide production protein ExoY